MMRSGSRRPALDDSSDDEGDPLDQYYMVSIQLLDLMHTLHSRTAQIFRWWKEEADQVQEDFDLWEVAWLPLLQGMAQFCTDRRKQVANTALAYLQRALLAPGMAGVGGAGWEASFRLLLFPLLQRRRRAKANTTMCKWNLFIARECIPSTSLPPARAAGAGHGGRGRRGLGGELPAAAVPAAAAPPPRQGQHHHVQEAARIQRFPADLTRYVVSSGDHVPRALLAPGIAGVGGAGWEASFRLLLFPLLQRRRRAKANTTMCKV
ncbi:unnamed protein product [Plutella xylostella]|uniref:(diamondback moth) hypothetical protein n=1 Tax=Plutella xylostella TaxID=51655 RepID=A0A8S4FT18_PLUXY|nr:unnamed protein product [Plutella xylostella]